MRIVIEAPRNEIWAVIVELLGGVSPHGALNKTNERIQTILFFEVLPDRPVVTVNVYAPTNIRHWDAGGGNFNTEISELQLHVSPLVIVERTKRQ